MLFKKYNKCTYYKYKNVFSLLSKWHVIYTMCELRTKYRYGQSAVCTALDYLQWPGVETLQAQSMGMLMFWSGSVHTAGCPRLYS